MSVATYRKCPVCSHSQAEILCEINYRKSPGQLLPLQYQIASCSDCGFIYDDFEAGAAVFEQHYSNQNKYAMEVTAGAGGIAASDLDRYNQTVDFLNLHLSDKSLFTVDAGCGKGGLLTVLKQRGFTNICGFEISPGCAQYAKRQLNVEVFCSDLLKIKEVFPDLPKIDLFILSHVAEHIFDLKQTMRTIRELLSENGMLYIEVPDASRYHQYTDSPYYYFDFEHINHFDTEHLDLLLRQFGFKTLGHLVTENYPVAATPFPTCSGLYQLDDGKFKLSRNLKQYVCNSEVREKNRVLPYQESDPVFVWGLGAYFERLRYEKIFDSYHIRGFIDIDKQKTGQMIDGIPVCSPEILQEYNSENALVIITSVLYAPQITRQLETMEWRGKIADFR